MRLECLVVPLAVLAMLDAGVGAAADPKAPSAARRTEGSKMPDSGQRTETRAAIEPLRYVLLDISYFHADGFAVWLSQSGHLTVQKVSAVPPGKRMSPEDDGTRVEVVVREARLPPAALTRVEAAIETAVKSGLRVTDRLGIPDETRVTVAVRDARGDLHVLEAWSADVGQLDEPVRQLFGLARSLAQAHEGALKSEQTMRAEKLKLEWPATLEPLPARR
jgi:hypothetical protein